MSQPICPECGSPLPAGAPEGSCATCLLMLGVGVPVVEVSPAHPETPAAEKPTENSARTEQSGQRIGRYKLLEQIGEGGFGAVWMAEQQEPVRRRVALKILKLGMDTREVVARFEAERQALAMMDHANIAKVLDAGATENGRPYFVMELVAGVPITTFCDAHRLSTRERIELFVLVCEAVQHAHQKGVIHRDLKPGNILVSEQDGRFLPKVIDFGVAKALAEPLTDKTLFTRYQQFLGTPAYMSPEQAGLGGLDVDTRSDIYSLGVLLYELLTGKPPFDPHLFAGQNRDAWLKTIREVEPPKPSTRLTQALVAADVRRRTSAQPDESASSRRRLQELIQLLRGELDWIILKALDKDRARRYATANGFAADLRRYLSGEAVTAAPPTVAYRFAKFARKNRIAIATGTAFAALLLAGIVATAWQAVRATHSARESGEQRDKAQVAQKTADLNAAETRRELYVARIRLAHQAWQEGNFEQAEKMLAATIPEAGQEDLRDFEWRYLRKLFHDESRVTFTNAVFEIEKWGVPHPFGGLAANGSTLIVGCSNTIKWLDVQQQREVQVINVGTNSIGPFAFATSRPGLIAYGTDTIKGLSPTGEPLFGAGLNHKFCAVLAWSWDGALLASGDVDGLKEIKLWDVKTGTQVGPGLRLDEGVVSLAFSPDAKFLVCGDWGTEIHVFVTRTLKLAKTLTNHTAMVHRLAFDRTGTRLASGSHDGHIRVWSFPDCQLVADLTGHQGDLSDLTFSPDGQRLASGGSDHTVRLWDLAGPTAATFLHGHRGRLTSVLFSQDGKDLYTASDDGTVKVWPVPLTDSTNILRHAQWLSATAFSPQGTLLAVEDYHARATVLWDVPGRKRIGNLVQHAADFLVGEVAFSPDGQLLATAGVNEVAQVWSLSEQKMFFEFPKVKGSAVSLAFHPSKPILAVGCRVVHFWDLQNGKEINLLREPPDHGVASVAFSPDGEWLGLGMRDGRVSLWNLATQRESKQFKEHSDSVSVPALCFSHDGDWLASGGSDKRVALYDMRRQRLVAHLDGHTRSVRGLAFTPGDKSLVSTSLDGTVRFWYVANGQLALTLAHDGGPVTAVSFSPDGNLMATAGADGTVRLWPAVSKEEMAADQRPLKK